MTTSLRLVATGTWRDRASCRDIDPNLFFPPPGDRGAKAKAVCASCPVRRQCLADALDRAEPMGIWGGLNTRERDNPRDAARLRSHAI
jgi:WhiB family redox-sensing transcriptional regulator